MPAWRTTWLEFTSTGRSHIKYPMVFKCFCFECGWISLGHFCLSPVQLSRLWKRLQQEEPTQESPGRARAAWGFQVSDLYKSDAKNYWLIELNVFFLNVDATSKDVLRNFLLRGNWRIMKKSTKVGQLPGKWPVDLCFCFWIHVLKQAGITKRCS